MAVLRFEKSPPARLGFGSVTTLVFIHILGAAIWTGGLFFVALVAVGAKRTLPERERSDLFHFIGWGFLGMAGFAALLLGTSGNFLVEDLFGGWNGLSGEFEELIIWKTVLFLIVLVLALIHSLVFGPRIRRLRIRADESGLSEAEEASLRRAARISGVTQVLMLAGTLAILVLAAEMVT